RLHESLIENKNKYFPSVSLSKYGFTADCPRTDESAEKFKDDDEKPISSVAYVKIRTSEDAKKEITEELKDLLNSKYTFTNEIGKLGQQKKHKISYVAVVHIDGNQMGDRFKSCGSLEGLRDLSKSVRKATKSTFHSMIERLIRKIEDKTLSEKNDFVFERDDGKTILPVRPIIIGGDDITFVSEGRLGVWLAETFMREFTKQKVSMGKKPLSSCGGIAIVKTKYPFFRAYKMAEYLIDKAKRRSRGVKSSSYIDFLASSRGWVGEEIDKNYYEVPAGNLHFGPYRIDGVVSEDSHIENLKNIIKGLKELPRNKVMQLREVLYRDERDAKMFVEELNARGYKLPEIPGFNYHKKIWQDKKTPYFDAIEIMEFYPEVLL
ncbi:MAG: hypothetical protein DRP50_05985, partial [Thermotoga sp.]